MSLKWASAGEMVAGAGAGVDWVQAVPERASRRAQSRERCMKFLGEDEYKGGVDESGRAVRDTPPFAKAQRMGHPKLCRMTTSKKASHARMTAEMWRRECGLG